MQNYLSMKKEMITMALPKMVTNATKAINTVIHGDILTATSGYTVAFAHVVSSTVVAEDPDGENHVAFSIADNNFLSKLLIVTSASFFARRRLSITAYSI